MHDLAGPIDAAVGIEIAVDGGLGRAAGDAAVLGAPADSLLGQVHRRAVQVQHRQIALRAIGHHHLGVGCAFAVQQRTVEAHPALRVALRHGQVLAVARHQGHAHVRHHLGGLQRADHHVQRLGPVIGRQRHVGEHHPAPRLGRRVRIVVVVGAFALDRAAARGVAHLDHIGAGLHLLQHRAQREHRGHALAGALRGHRQLALPDHPALVVGAVRAVVARPLPLGGGVGGADRLAHQVAVDDPPDLDRQPADIDRLDPDPVGILARQDHALAGEPDEGRPFTKGKIDVGVGR